MCFLPIWHWKNRMFGYPGKASIMLNSAIPKSAILCVLIIFLIRWKIGLSKLTEKEIELKAELAKDENYSEQIEKYSAEVEKLDKKLGVNKK